MIAEPNRWQRVADRTGGAVTPANLIDAAAFAVGIWSASRLDTPLGVAGEAGSYLADLIDGPIARRTGTSNELGAEIDAAGDKLKTAYAACHILRGGQASRLLVGAVMVQNIANASAMAYDRLTDEELAGRVNADGVLAAPVNSIGAKLRDRADKLPDERERTKQVTGLAGKAIQGAAWTGAKLYQAAVHGKSSFEVTRSGKNSAFSNSLGIGLQTIGTELSKTHQKQGRQVKLAGAVIGYGGLVIFGGRASRQYWQAARS